MVEDLKQSNAELRKSQERTDLMLRSVQMASGSLELNVVLERIAEMLGIRHRDASLRHLLDG